MTTRDPPVVKSYWSDMNDVLNTLEILPDAFISTDQHGLILSFNRGAEQIFGYARDEVIGRSLDILLPERIRGRHGAHLKRFAQSPDVSRFMGDRQAVQGRRKDGSEFPAEAAIAKQRGRDVTLFVVLRDISDRLAKESALRESEELLRDILDQMFGFVGLCALDGTLVMANRAPLEAARLRPEQVLGRPFWETYWWSHSPRVQQDLKAALRAAACGETVRYDATVRVGDGRHITVDATFSPLRDATGAVAKILGFGVDISDRVEAAKTLREREHALQERVTELEAVKRELERRGAELERYAEELQTARDEAEAANNAKSKFLATMSHELRTPLNAIIGFSEIIKTEALGPVGTTQYRSYASDIFDSGEHLLAIINDILDLSRVETGLGMLVEEKVEIRAIVDSVLPLVSRRSDDKKIEIDIDVPTDLPPLIADGRKLKQILVNIIGNSLKFTEAHGKIRVSAWCRADSGLVLQVTDTGIGMAPQDIPKALSVFGQIDSELNRKYAGTGLGLPLTKALVEAHGGSLDLQSAVGKGTTVTIRLPAARLVPTREPAGAGGCVGSAGSADN